jgi:acyl transferase domain-containing protein/NADPH:quinone reductase-like Zn-dependent oxidoreductase/surfactin synthase thioesterase subunit
MSHTNSLAVVGIGCRFPGHVNNPTDFWQALLEGRDGIRPVPADRWARDAYYDPDKDKAGKTKNDRGGFIDDVDKFDAEFFGYFPAEANRIDPQQRLLLEVTHEALEDAGLPIERMAGSRTSVFIGSFMYDYLCMQTAAESRDQINPYVAMGTGITSLANRISYVFDLKGPSVSLDTACSSSMVALHLACRSVWNGEADLAIAGGVNLILRPESTVMLSKAGFLNPDGYCKAFDASANGYVRAEGAGVVILKPLDKATADGDHIYAIVRGTAVNQDGYVADGFTVPSADAQIEVLRAAYADAEVDPSTVQYIEAHGPGTVVGDPIECEALGTVVGQARADGRCLIGSVKTNIGHLEGAAGIAGFIKGVLVAHHGVAPRNLHFKNPNPNIDFDGLRLQVADRPYDLDSSGPIRVGVNSFGAGGTNAHAVLESPPRLPAREVGSATSIARPFLFSAKTRDALQKLAIEHAARLEAGGADLGALGYSLLNRRSRYPVSLTVSAAAAQELANRLRKFAAGERESQAVVTQAEVKRQPKVAFMFSGQGGQWAEMGQTLYASEPKFREVTDELDRLFSGIAGWSVLEHIKAPKATSSINDTVVVQPAIMSIQVALARLLIHYGIAPDAIVGHSIGEVAAAHLSGALTLEQAVTVIYHRSQIQNRAAGKGKMLAAGVTHERAAELLRGDECRASVATVNGPRMITIAGDAPVLERIAATLEAEGVFNRFVRVDVPYHSHHMEPLRDDLIATLGHVVGADAAIPLYSTVTTRRESGRHLTGEYWYANVREPVLFTKTIESMLDDGYQLFVEVGPHPVLASGASDLFKKLGRDAFACGAMMRELPEQAAFNLTIGQLAAHGVTPNLTMLFGNAAFSPLPKHPWNRQRCWFELPDAQRQRVAPYAHPFLKSETRLVSEDSARIWKTNIGVGTFPFLKDHQVDGECVFPGAGHLETAYAVANEAFPGRDVCLRDVRFESALILAEDNRLPLDVRLEVSSNEGDYHICSRAVDASDDQPWVKHSAGRITFLPEPHRNGCEEFSALAARFEATEGVAVGAFYETIRKAGLDYGRAFRCVNKLWRQGSEVFAHLRLPADLEYEGGRFLSHPALLDACLHTVFLDVHHNGDPSRVYLPYTIDRVKIHSRFGGEVRSYLRVTRNDEQFLVFDLFVFGLGGEPLAQLDGITCKIIGGARNKSSESLYEGCYEYTWAPEDMSAGVHQQYHDLNHCVLVTAAGGFFYPLKADLTARGLRVTELTDPIAFKLEGRRWLGDQLAALRPDRRTTILYACGPCAGQQGFDDWLDREGVPDYIQGLLNLTQAIADRQVYPRLAVVTCGTVPIPTDAAVNLGQSVLTGMMRVVKNELPNVPSRVIDLPAAPELHHLAELVHEVVTLRHDLDEFEVALRDRRLVRKLVAVRKEAAEDKGTVELPGIGGNYRASLAEIGMLDSVEFRQTPEEPVGVGDVEIDVLAAALNFKDIMNGMGVLPAKAVKGGLAGDQLGLEVSGRVRRCGAGTAFQAGQRVMARVTHGFSGRLIARQGCVAPLPDHLTPAQGAAIPVVFLTAYYGLRHLGRMEKGDIVLIHSAAGGVGAAAIQLAKLTGATVIATAGTKDKRQWLRDQGIEHVFDSRSLDFHPRVMEATGGRGVDIVLNSLTGNFITQGLKSLAPFGRFIKIGKADIYKNNKLAMERLGENISVHIVDVDRMAVQRPDLHRRLLDEVVALFAAGKLQAPELVEYPVTRLADAMKFMSRAAYVGKVVVTMEGQTVRALPPARTEVSCTGGYLVVGGTGGFGLEVAKWLAASGARRLVLAGRSGLKTAADRQAVDALRAAGVEVIVEKLDVSRGDAVLACLSKFGREWPELYGVVHAAGVLKDAALGNMTPAAFREVFLPKAVGAWNLHRAVEQLGHRPRMFVCLSSISSVLGLFGQVNYAAANYALDSLVEMRRAKGLPGSSLNLGVLGDYAGMSRTANDAANVLALLESHGMPSMPLADVLGKLNLALAHRAGQRMIARFDWNRFTAVYPHLQRDQRFSACIEESRASLNGKTKRGGNLVCQLAGLEPALRLDTLGGEVAKALGRILDAAPEKIDRTVSIDKFSLDSLMLNQLRNWILRSLEVNYPLIKLLKGPSVNAIAESLLQQLGDGGGAGVIAAETDSAETAEFLADPNFEQLTPWLVRGKGERVGQTRLFCFHSMGVGASLFTRFLIDPPKGYDIFAIQTPGRENRVAEPAMDRVEQLVDQIVRQLEPWMDRPFVVWGHSFGGIVAYETLKRLRSMGRRLPLAFAVTGTIAPTLIRVWQTREVMLKAVAASNNAEYLISLSRYVEDVEFIKRILPLMRKDTPLMMNYRYFAEAPFAFPIVAFGARQDDMVYLDEIALWRDQTAGGFELVEVDGDHWFLNRNRELILAKLEAINLSWSDSETPPSRPLDCTPPPSQSKWRLMLPDAVARQRPELDSRTTAASPVSTRVDG